MAILPIVFPTERERLRRLIEADQGLSFHQRVQAIDGLLNFVDQFELSDDVRAGRARFELIERREKERGLHEFLRQQIAVQAELGRTAD